MAGLFIMLKEKKLIMINILKNILYITVGIYFILSPLIYKLLLILRLPKTILDIPFSLALCSSSLFIFFSLIIIQRLYFSLKEETLIAKKFKLYISNPLKQLYFDSLTLIDNYIKHTLLGPQILGESLKSITIYLNKTLTEKSLRIMFFLFDIFPKIIFLVLLILDILYYHQLKYIYLFGMLTLVPMIFRYLIYTFKEFALHNIKYSLNYLCFYTQDYIELSFEDILDNFLTNSYQQSIIPHYIKHVTLKETLANEAYFDNVLDTYLDQFHIFTQLYNNIDFLEHLKKMKSYQLFMLTIYCNYAGIWFYICLLLVTK